MKFKKGDRIVCVDNRYKPNELSTWLTNGKSYIVKSLSNSFGVVIGVWIDNDKDVFSSYGLYRFKLISEVRSEVIEDILS